MAMVCGNSFLRISGGRQSPPKLVRKPHKIEVTGCWTGSPLKLKEVNDQNIILYSTRSLQRLNDAPLSLSRSNRRVRRAIIVSLSLLLKLPWCCRLHTRTHTQASTHARTQTMTQNSDKHLSFQHMPCGLKQQ